MRKITTLLVFALVCFSASAQFTYSTIRTSGFEVTDSLPSTFTRTGQATWATATAPYTGKLWDLIFASAAPKDYVVSANTADYHLGSQCIQITTGTSTSALRLRTSSTYPVFSPSIGDWSRYRVTIWAKGTAGSQIFLNNSNLATGGWDKYIFTTNYSTGIGETRLMLDFKATGGTSTTFYLDDVLVEKYNQADPVTSAATGVSPSGFTANWGTVAGATSYTLSYQASGATSWTTVTIPGGLTTSSDISGLTANTLYLYKVVATDGTNLSPTSNTTQVTTSPTTSLNLIKSISQVYTQNGNIIVNTQAGLSIDVYNSVGQKLASRLSVSGVNTISVNANGVLLVKAGNETTKVIL